MKSSNTTLFVSPIIVRKYNATAAFVFAQVAYHIVKHGKYDTAHIATANYTGVAKSTVIKYLKKFCEDKILIKIQFVFYPFFDLQHILFHYKRIHYFFLPSNSGNNDICSRLAVARDISWRRLISSWNSVTS